MNDIVKKMISILLAFIIIRYSFSFCNEYHIISV